MLKNSYKATLTACFTGYVTQAVVVNFLPLLFLTFCNGYGILLEHVTLLITVNFLVQLFIDMVSSKFIDKIGYRASIVLANVSAAVGLILLAFLPDIINPYVALIISVVLCAVGSGLEEVLISPIVEACPTKRKSAIMSLAHSFYCWGTVAVIGLSTLFFVSVGLENWKILSLLWAIVPVFNVCIFLIVPIFNQKDGSAHGGGIIQLFKNKIFWILAILMICSGAAEQAMGQWASAFTESALGVDKTVGDLLGACFFALCMAISRTLYATLSEKIKLEKFMIFSAIFCVIAYAGAVFSPFAWMSLLSCGLCGFSVGIMWPGTISLATKAVTGGTAMFAFLALFGDVGCTAGPTIVGLVSGAFNDDLKKGLALAIIFPVLMIIGVIAIVRKRKNKDKRAENCGEKVE